MEHVLIAHILPPSGPGAEPRVQTLEEHSRHVAELCADACRPFGLENTGRLMGWLHDVGKAVLLPKSITFHFLYGNIYIWLLLDYPYLQKHYSFQN